MSAPTPSVPYLDLGPQYRALKPAIDARIQKVLDHGQFILGPEVAESEKALAAFVGAKHALTMASGTDALLAALIALDIRPGDEVITTPFTFFATSEVVSLIGAVPVFGDIDPVTYNLTVESAENRITSRTKIIMPVSLYGQPADFKEFEELGRKRGLTIIEDSAQSFGAPYQGRRSGHLGSVSATSFFPAKPLGCYGDGGAVFTDDDKLAEKLAVVRVHGQKERYQHISLGINGRLDTIQCAILIEKLKRYEWEISQRQRIGKFYNEAFQSLEGQMALPKVKPDRDSVWAQYTVQVDDRVAFAAKLKELGVPTSVHYPIPLHHQPVYSAMKGKVHCPVAEKVAARVISLPLYADMPDAHVERVIAAVKQVLG